MVTLYRVLFLEAGNDALVVRVTTFQRRVNLHYKGIHLREWPEYWGGLNTGVA
jgi:hypothetical protein